MGGGGGGSGDLVEILRITSANIIQVGKKGISSEIPWNICVILCNSSIQKLDILLPPERLKVDRNVVEDPEIPETSPYIMA